MVRPAGCSVTSGGGCTKSFNALTGTPLARLRHKAKWLEQAQALHEGLSVHQAAERLQVAPSAAFHWRHRFRRIRANPLEVWLANDTPYGCTVV